MKTSFVFHRNHNIQIIGNETRSKHQERNIWLEKRNRILQLAYLVREKKGGKNVRFPSKRNDFSFSPGFYLGENAYIFTDTARLCV